MRYTLSLLLLICLSNVVVAQQSFFNVPSSDITTKNKLFFQQQVSIFQTGMQVNSTCSYGLGKNFEAGLNLLGVTYEFDNKFLFNDRVPPYSPLFVINGQKKFVLSRSFSIGTGTQLGLNRIGKAAEYAYSNGVCRVEKSKTKLVAGLYYSSDGFFGPESRNWSDNPAIKKFGLQWGIEQNLWKDKLFLQTDYISGRHSLGQIVFGGAYCVSHHWVVSSGLQVATSHSKAMDELVFELTYVPG